MNVSIKEYIIINYELINGMIQQFILPEQQYVRLLSADSSISFTKQSYINQANIVFRDELKSIKIKIFLNNCKTIIESLLTIGFKPKEVYAKLAKLKLLYMHGYKETIKASPFMSFLKQHFKEAYIPSNPIDKAADKLSHQSVEKEETTKSAKKLLDVGTTIVASDTQHPFDLACKVFGELDGYRYDDVDSKILNQFSHERFKKVDLSTKTPKELFTYYHAPMNSFEMIGEERWFCFNAKFTKLNMVEKIIEKNGFRDYDLISTTQIGSIDIPVFRYYGGKLFKIDKDLHTLNTHAKTAVSRGHSNAKAIVDKYNFRY